MFFYEVSLDDLWPPKIPDSETSDGSNICDRVAEWQSGIRASVYMAIAQYDLEPAEQTTAE